MKRVAAVIALVVALLVGYYVAIPGNQGDSKTGDFSTVKQKSYGVALKLDREVYSPTDEMTITIVNNGNLNITTCYNFRLYKLNDGQWVEVPVNLMFIQVAVTIEPGKSWAQRVKLSSLNLEPGHYKIEKTVVATDPVTKMAMGQEVWAEFDVKG